MSEPMEILSGPADAVLSIGTRKSLLAKKQAEEVAALLEAAWPAELKGRIAVKGLVPLGDRDKVTPLWDFSTEERKPAAEPAAAAGGKVVPPIGSRQSDAKGLWTNELEDELEKGGVDVLVHSLKDTPTTIPAQFELGAITAREDARDVLIVHPKLIAHEKSTNGSYKPCLANLPAKSRIGTSSLRRIAQLRHQYPSFEFIPLRGNLPTRISKLENAPWEVDAEAKEGEGPLPIQAIILAAAGMHRLGLADQISEYLLPDGEGKAGEAGSPDVLYAVGQGALCVEIRAGDERVRRLVEPLVDVRAMLECSAERAMLRKLEGGCSVPVGVVSSWKKQKGEEEGGEVLALRGRVVDIKGERVVEVSRSVELAGMPAMPAAPGDVPFVQQEGMKGALELCERLGRELADELVKGGADAILDEIKKARK